MTVEFLAAYHVEGAPIERVLTDLLVKVLQDNLSEFEPDNVQQMIVLRHSRSGHQISDQGGEVRYSLLGFALQLPDGTTQMELVVEDFAAALSDTPPIFHAVKFEDPLLRSELARRAAQVFALEMKLRRVLSLIYLHARHADDPYDLLRDEFVQPASKEKPTSEQMKTAVENQFFHLTFGQYIELNTRPDVRLSALLELIHDQESYEAFRDELKRLPVTHEEDALLIAGLKERMNAIEAMRNCVAHNRRPGRRTTENFDNARPLLEGMLDDYLARWEHASEDPQPSERDNDRRMTAHGEPATIGYGSEQGKNDAEQSARPGDRE